MATFIITHFISTSYTHRIFSIHNAYWHYVNEPNATELFELKLSQTIILLFEACNYQFFSIRFKYDSMNALSTVKNSTLYTDKYWQFSLCTKEYKYNIIQIKTYIYIYYLQCQEDIQQTRTRTHSEYIYTYKCIHTRRDEWMNGWARAYSLNCLAKKVIFLTNHDFVSEHYKR